MATKLRNGKYRVRLRVGGRRMSATFSNLKDAEKKESELTRAQELIRAGMEAPKESVLLIDYAGSWLRRRERAGLAIGTVRQDEARLRLYLLGKLGPLPLPMVTTKILRDLLNDVQAEPWKYDPKRKPDQGPLANATRNRIRALLHTLFQDAFQDELVVANPVARIPLEDEKKRARPAVEPLAQDDTDRLIKAGYSRSPLAGFCAVLFIYTGGRVSQMAGLQNRDFDLARGKLTFARIYEQASLTIQNRIKGRPEGIVMPLFPRVKEAFQAHMQATPFRAPTDFCLPQESGQPHSTYQLRNLIEALCLEAGIRAITPHVLRATFATLAEEAGFSKEDLQRMLGHSSVLVTQRYTRRETQPLLEKAERLGFGKRGKGGSDE